MCGDSFAKLHPTDRFLDKLPGSRRMHGPADVLAMPVSPLIKASPVGRFICSACGLPLFTSADKIAAGSLDGRSSSPTFSGAISGSVIRTPDYVGGCVNTTCTGCGASLGHVTKRCSRPNRHRPDGGHSLRASRPSAALTRDIPCDQARGRRRRHLVLPRVRLAAEICAGSSTYNQAAMTSFGRSSCCQSHRSTSSVAPNCGLSYRTC